MNLIETGELIKKVLGDEYKHLNVTCVKLRDDMEGTCQALVTVNKIELAGTGLGAVDALFGALHKHYTKKHFSLQSVTLTDFKVSMTRKKIAKKSNIDGGDTVCEATMTLKNSYGTKLDFSNASGSLAAATAGVVALGVEHFINAEKAYSAINRALSDAKKRNRQDLVTKYTHELSSVVRCTSFTEID